MRYSASLVKDILTELEKIPIVRQVCSKFGIDHSTFYRWLTKHPDFHARVVKAQFLGRKRVVDAAESIILNGIQNNEFKAATFYLTHNEQRYMSLHKGKHHQLLIENLITSLTQRSSENDPATFEKMFEVIDQAEDIGNKPELVDRWINPLIELIGLEDPKLVEVFRAAYANWKKEKKNFENKMKESGLEDGSL